MHTSNKPSYKNSWANNLKVGVTRAQTITKNRGKPYKLILKFSCIVC